jgi:hypothetical protein
MARTYGDQSDLAVGEEVMAATAARQHPPVDSG